MGSTGGFACLTALLCVVVSYAYHSSRCFCLFVVCASSYVVVIAVRVIF